MAQDDFAVESELDEAPIQELEDVPLQNSVVETPTEQPRFVKPPAPKKGGTLVVPHPDAARGLVRINKDGSYQYQTNQINKNQAASFRIGSISPPKIAGPGNVSFADMYGKSDLVGILGDYEWQPFRGFGALGLQLGVGLVLTRGNGRFRDLGIAREVYDLFVIPVSTFLVYRFEFVRRQWFVPFVSGGGIIYGLVEKRDDTKPAKFATAPAAGFGGGIHFSISRWDLKSAFIMQKEYGIADLWLTTEVRVIQGLRSDIDFTNRTASLGITVDY